MKLSMQWKEKLIFTATDGRNSVTMDTKSPVGTDSALSPKQLLLAGVCGCTAMDIVSLLKKYKQSPSEFTIEADAPVVEGKQPAVFEKMELSFRLHGNLEKEKLIEAVKLSQTKFCGVSAMISKVVPITYKVFLNDTLICEDKAHFEI